MISAHIAQLDACSIDMYDQTVYGTPHIYQIERTLALPDASGSRLVSPLGHPT